MKKNRTKIVLPNITPRVDKESVRSVSHVSSEATIDKVKKAIELKNFIMINPNLSTENEDYSKFIDELFKEMEKDGCVTIPPQKKYYDNKVENYLVILLNLIDVYEYDPKLYLAYHRAKKRYKLDKKKKKGIFQFSYDRVKEFTDFLERYGYIEQTLGYPELGDYAKSHISKMRATEKLIDKLHCHVFMPEKEEIKYDYTIEETVIVKGKKPKKKKIRYLDKKKDKIRTKTIQTPRPIIQTPDNPTVRQIRETLAAINRVMHNAKITLDATEEELKEYNRSLAYDSDPKIRVIDFRRKYLHRVFLGKNLNLGGRFYGAWYQSIPSDLRKKVLINGAPVYEPDFSSYHLKMLYDIIPTDIPKGDQYQLEGYPTTKAMRNFLKMVMLIAINAYDEKTAIAAIRDTIRKDRESKAKRGIEVEPIGIGKLTDDNIKIVINKFREKHKRIEHFFFTGFGNTLQYYDSQLTEYILIHFANQGYPCLPIHDSYMIDLRLMDELLQVMDDAYCKAFQKETSDEHPLLKGRITLDFSGPSETIKRLWNRKKFTEEEKLEIKKEEEEIHKRIIELLKRDLELREKRESNEK